MNLATSGSNPALDDTMQRFLLSEIKDETDAPQATVSPMSIHVSKTMDCDNHPSCDCYSQCGAIIW